MAGMGSLEVCEQCCRADHVLCRMADEPALSIQECYCIRCPAFQLCKLFTVEKPCPLPLWKLAGGSQCRDTQGCTCNRFAAHMLDDLVFPGQGKSQIDYALGSTGRSYVVGFGQKSPKSPFQKVCCTLG